MSLKTSVPSSSPGRRAPALMITQGCLGRSPASVGVFSIARTVHLHVSSEVHVWRSGNEAIGTKGEIRQIISIYWRDEEDVR